MKPNRWIYVAQNLVHYVTIEPPFDREELEREIREEAHRLMWRDPLPVKLYGSGRVIECRLRPALLGRALAEDRFTTSDRELVGVDIVILEARSSDRVRRAIARLPGVDLDDNLVLLSADELRLEALIQFGAGAIVLTQAAHRAGEVVPDHVLVTKHDPAAIG